MNYWRKVLSPSETQLNLTRVWKVSLVWVWHFPGSMGLLHALCAVLWWNTCCSLLFGLLAHKGHFRTALPLTSSFAVCSCGLQPLHPHGSARRASGGMGYGRDCSSALGWWTEGSSVTRGWILEESCVSAGSDGSVLPSSVSCFAHISVPWLLTSLAFWPAETVAHRASSVQEKCVEGWHVCLSDKMPPLYGSKLFLPIIVLGSYYVSYLKLYYNVAYKVKVCCCNNSVTISCLCLWKK